MRSAPSLYKSEGLGGPPARSSRIASRDILTAFWRKGLLAAVLSINTSSTMKFRFPTFARSSRDLL